MAGRLQQKCSHAEGRDMPPEWCGAHHLTPWAIGGKTDPKNSVLFCPHHHRMAHALGFPHERSPDGTVRFTRRPSAGLSGSHRHPPDAEPGAARLPAAVDIFPTGVEIPHAPVRGESSWEWGSASRCGVPPLPARHPTIESAPNPAADPIDSQNSRWVPVSGTAIVAGEAGGRRPSLTPEAGENTLRNGSAANSPTQQQQPNLQQHAA